MKIGDLEIPDSAVEDALKGAGRRVVDEKDFLSKSEQALLVAKIKDALGGRSVDDLPKIVEAYGEIEKKNKTQTELLTSEVKRLQAEIEKREIAAKELQRQVRMRDVDDYFQQAMEKEKLAIIPSILSEVKKTFYDREASPEKKAEFDRDVAAALKGAYERQAKELAALGIGPTTPQTGISGGGRNRDGAAAVGSDADIQAILKSTSSGPFESGFGKRAPFETRIPERK